MYFEKIKRQIVRNTILCQSIEPLGDKSECTTRFYDSSEGTKLEYFIVSAVNSSWAFYDLVNEIDTQSCQPKSIFKFAYEAQKLSSTNRLGSKVNFGQIQLLIPLVTSHMLTIIENREVSARAIAINSVEVLKNTTSLDIEYLEKFINLGREISYLHHSIIKDKVVNKKQFERDLNDKNIFEVAQKFKNIHIIDEMISGYPLSLFTYEYIKKNYHKGIIKCTEEIYHDLKQKVKRYDVAADIIVVGIYLALSELADEIIFR
jgi:triphosphoribosyl-dephospho-CoA synthetase